MTDHTPDDTGADDERPEDQEPQETNGVDPLQDFFRSLGINSEGEAFDLNALMSQLQQALSSMSDSVTAMSIDEGINWQHTKQSTRAFVAAKGPDPTPTSTNRRRVADTVRLAEMWLDEVVSFPQAEHPPMAWSRAEWVENTMDAWQGIVEPIITTLSGAMTTLFSLEGGGISDLGGFGAMISSMLRGAAASMYTSHLIEALSGLATQVLTGTEIGLQILPQPRVTVIMTNVAAFSEGLEVDEDDLLLHLCVREAARQRLFAAVPWLAPQLLALLEHYAREITIDANALQEAISLDEIEELTPEKLEEASSQLQGRLFEPTKTPEQEAILQRLENLLALIEGWVDVITAAATTKWMPTSAALVETLRRRRAIGGPAEKLFQTLVGLDLRPRRVRDAANLWAALADAHGPSGREDAWRHPDLMPTASDLDDPLGYVAGESHQEPDEMDAELAKLLEEGTNEDHSSDP